MDSRHGFRTVQIGEGSGNTQSSVETASGQLQCLSGLAQENEAVSVRPSDFFEYTSGCLRIGPRAVWSVLGEPLTLAFARSDHTSPHRCAPFGRRRENQIGGRDRRHLDLQVDPIEQRT